MNLYKIICPYCEFPNITPEYVEGYQAAVCRQCGQPFLNLTEMVPQFTSLRVVGFVDVCSKIPSLEEIEEDAKYYAKHPEELDATICNDCIECNGAEQTSPSCEQNSKDVNKSDDKLNKCSKCGLAYEDHGITTGVCPVCFLDEDSTKGNAGNTDDASTNNIQQSSNEFRPLSNNFHVSYRCDGDYVDLRYNGACNTRTSWADIYTLVEELHESDNISPSIKLLIGDKVGSINARVACINAFVHAVSEGTISEASALDKDDADFKPLLKGVIDTRCNYDGGKVGGWS